MGITPLSHDDDITDPIYFQNKGRYYAMIQKVDSSIVMYQRLLDLIKKHRVSLSEWRTFRKCFQRNRLQESVW